MSEIRTDTINNASGDNDSGIDLSTNDQVGIKTANTTALTVDASQNVGIGTSAVGEKLDVQDTANVAIRAKTTNTNGIANLILTNDAEEFRIRVNGGNSDALEFCDGTTARMVMTPAGNLLVGKTSDDNSTVGTRFQSDGFASLVRDGDASLLLRRNTSNGNILRINKDGTDAGAIGVLNGNNLTVGGTVSGHGGIQFGNNNVTPMSAGSEADNLVDLGASNLRYDDIYATNPNISTSDRNEKQDIEELTEAEQRVAVACKGLMRKYRWRDSVAKKGDNARTHFGIIAQDLQDAFTAEGLDAGDYAMFTSNTWWEKEISVDAVEADEENGIEAKDAYTYMDTKEEATEGYTERTRLGVRYSELLAFIISAL